MRNTAAFPVSFKSLDDAEQPGMFEAIVAVFGTPDRPDMFGQMDIIEPGAFAETLAKKGAPPIVWGHLWDVPPIGAPVQAMEVPQGLYVKGRLFLDDQGISGQYARSVHTGMLNGVVKEFSFAFEVNDYAMEKRDGQDVRVLKRLELFEAGPVLIGRHPDTELISAKSKLEETLKSIAVPDPLRAQRLLDIFMGRTGRKAGARNANSDLARLNQIKDLAGEIRDLAIQNGAEG